MMDRSRQEQIYKDYKDKVYSYVLHRVHSKEDAEDLVTDIFIKIIDKYESFDESKAGISTWIFQITRNRVIDYYRSYKMPEEVPEDLAGDGDVDEGIISEETLSELAAALEKLPEQQKDIIVQRYYHGKTLQEISRMMSLSYGVTKLRHKEALIRLQNYMKL